MSESAAQVRKLHRQQAAVAHFGSFALRESDLLKVLTEAARVCAECLSVPFSKVCRYREKENDLLIEAGHGWHSGVIGNGVSRADVTSPQGRAFITGRPSICNDLRDDNDFELPSFYAEHGIVSTIGVIIKGNDGQPYGVQSGMDSGWYDDWSNRSAEAQASILATARSGPSKSPSNASHLPPEGTEPVSPSSEGGQRENHPSAAKLHLFSNHRAAVSHLPQADEAHADRAKRPQY
jgi:hypothetical protein